MPRCEIKTFFDSVAVAYGSVWWAGDIDYCPDALYEESVPCADCERELRLDRLPKERYSRGIKA